MLAAMAGTTVSFFRSNSELSKLFDKAINDGWTADRLLAESRNTKWYKTNSAPEREAQVLKHSDPDEYKRRLAQMRSTVHRMHKEIGGSSNFSKKELDTAARLAFINGWNETQIRSHLGSLNNIYQRVRQGKTLGGQAGQTLGRLNQLAFENGVKVNARTMGEWVQGIAAGKRTEQGVQELIRRRAMSAFPGLREEIAGGMSVREFADQYIETMGDILEINAADINLFDKDIRAAINTKDSKGKYSPMSLADFEVRMRKDPRWNKTGKARDSTMATGREVLQAFGISW